MLVRNKQRELFIVQLFLFFAIVMLQIICDKPLAFYRRQNSRKNRQKDMIFTNFL